MCETHDFWRIDFELYHNGCDQSLLVLPTPALVANRSLTNSSPLTTTHASMTDDQTTFIVSPNSTLHAGTSEDSAECGSTHTGTWSTLEAPDLEMAVMEHNIPPCTHCFSEQTHLIEWRRHAYTDFYEHPHAETPDIPDRLHERLEETEDDRR